MKKWTKRKKTPKKTGEVSELPPSPPSSRWAAGFRSLNEVFSLPGRCWLPARLLFLPGEFFAPLKFPLGCFTIYGVRRFVFLAALCLDDGNCPLWWHNFLATMESGTFFIHQVDLGIRAIDEQNTMGRYAEL